jgi:hypothetical protein
MAQMIFSHPDKPLKAIVVKKRQNKILLVKSMLLLQFVIILAEAMWIYKLK